MLNTQVISIMANLLDLFNMTLPAGSVTWHDVNSIDNDCACGTYLNMDTSGLYFAYNTTSIMAVKYLQDIIFLYFSLQIKDCVIIKLSVK